MTMSLHRLLLFFLSLSVALVLGEVTSESSCVVGEDGSSNCLDDKEQDPVKQEAVVCEDGDPRCSGWAKVGECEANPGYMSKNCRKSCALCGNATETTNQDCQDNNERCSAWASTGQCESSPNFVIPACPKSCGVCGKDIPKLLEEMNKAFEDSKNEHRADYGDVKNIHETEWGVRQELDEAKRLQEETLEVIAKTETYMRETVFVDPFYAKVKSECKNRDERCSFWAAQGECEANPKYMKLQCSPACQTCEQIDFDTRCPYDNDAPTILNPGDLNKLFERLVNDEFYAQFEPTVLSRPSPSQEELDNGVQDGPWVLTLDNFTTDEECDRLIELGGTLGYEQSMDVGKKKFDGTYDKHQNKFRTSTNAWCTGDCYEDATTKQVLARIENVTGVPDSNSEFLQLLRYEETQQYRTHHDYIEHHTSRAQGVRILTVFLYLNDVEEGGGTDFPTLGLTVMPKRGKAVIWPSVLDSDPNAKDGRTEHQALPVIKGRKYGANAWLHQKDFKDAYKRNCI